LTCEDAEGRLTGNSAAHLLTHGAADLNGDEMSSGEEFREGSCLGCGYALRGLTEPRCPECGRGFDPLDPRTFRAGRPISRLTRLILRPVGLLWVILSLIGLGLVLSATRWPTAWRVPFRDLPLYWRLVREPRKQLLTPTDWLYTIGIVLSCLVLLAWLIRVLAQWATMRRLRLTRADRVNQSRRHALIALSIAGTAALAAVGWPFRVARLWVARLLRTPPPRGSSYWQVPPAPLNVDASDELAVMRSAVLQMPTPRERLAGLKLLMEHHPEAAPPVILEALASERDPENLCWLLRMLGLYRDTNTVTAIEPFLSHKATTVSAAAIDALGLIREPAIPLSISMSSQSTTSTPPIGLWKFIDGRAVRRDPRYRMTGDAIDMTPRDLPQRLQKRLLAFMLNGPTAEQRQAAARVLVSWPPEPYQLRVAEWGVLIASGAGYALPKSVIEEIPPFVHQTGNLHAEFRARAPIMLITKPVIHITTDQPMAVDLEVQIRGGRPWFAYPMPHDFGLCVHNGSHMGVGNDDPPKKFDNPSLSALKDLWEGYPWLNPPHRERWQGDIAGVGVRWQSLVVTPARQTWMSPPEVPGDPKYAWWSGLREVPSSWIWNRDESERFIYYDGPTDAPAPVVVSRNGSRLQFTIARIPPVWYLDNTNGRQIRRARPDDWFTGMIQTQAVTGRGGLFVELQNQVMRFAKVAVPTGTRSLEMNLTLGNESDAAAALWELLSARGLSAAEATGLIDAWRAQFFRTPGARFVMLMSSADYDLLCPIQVRPKPTQLVRVGLILTEFNAPV
jgi:hypothetical protein